MFEVIIVIIMGASLWIGGLILNSNQKREWTKRSEEFQKQVEKERQLADEAFKKRMGEKYHKKMK